MKKKRKEKKMKSLGYTTPTVSLLQNPVKASLDWRSSSSSSSSSSSRRIVISSTCLLAVSHNPVGVALAEAEAEAEKWGVRSFIWEKFFEPDLSPEASVERITQTAEGLHALRHMLDTMSWRYVIFYIRVKQSYLSKDLNIAISTLPKQRRKDYVDLANDLVHNMSKLDEFVRTPKVYESYLYYEKTLKSIDDVVAFLA
ncbi:photosynthetic NDH subunit of lumenal location 2, chloroplastic [Euphorbia lathyris]|uniref:photosynthetic NDH subunit of lumenal location 2, chloroplastic n=1 Tax=Euphorbia lathyris TaxID=212925 RepID=UPI0033137412